MDEPDEVNTPGELNTPEETDREEQNDLSPAIHNYLDRKPHVLIQRYIEEVGEGMYLGEDLAFSVGICPPLPFACPDGTRDPRLDALCSQIESWYPGSVQRLAQEGLSTEYILLRYQREIDRRGRLALVALAAVEDPRAHYDPDEEAHEAPSEEREQGRDTSTRDGSSRSSCEKRDGGRG